MSSLEPPNNRVTVLLADVRGAGLTAVFLLFLEMIRNTVAKTFWLTLHPLGFYRE